VPVAATLKEVAFPAVTVWLAGCAVIEGATLALTENVALSTSVPPVGIVTNCVIVCVPLATLIVFQLYAVPSLAVPAKSKGKSDSQCAAVLVMDGLSSQ
jgi:hypothetical protein